VAGGGVDILLDHTERGTPLGLILLKIAIFDPNCKI
jgi:hypothetical protein